MLVFSFALPCAIVACWSFVWLTCFAIFAAVTQICCCHRFVENMKALPTKMLCVSIPGTSQIELQLEDGRDTTPGQSIGRERSLPSPSCWLISLSWFDCMDLLPCLDLRYQCYWAMTKSIFAWCQMQKGQVTVIYLCQKIVPASQIMLAQERSISNQSCTCSERFDRDSLRFERHVWLQEMSGASALAANSHSIVHHAIITGDFSPY